MSFGFLFPLFLRETQQFFPQRQQAVRFQPFASCEEDGSCCPLTQTMGALTSGFAGALTSGFEGALTSGFAAGVRSRLTADEDLPPKGRVEPSASGSQSPAPFQYFLLLLDI